MKDNYWMSKDKMELLDILFISCIIINFDLIDRYMLTEEEAISMVISNEYIFERGGSDLK